MAYSQIRDVLFSVLFRPPDTALVCSGLVHLHRSVECFTQNNECDRILSSANAAFLMGGHVLFRVMFNGVTPKVLFRCGNQDTISLCCVQMIVQAEHLFEFSELCSVPLL